MDRSYPDQPFVGVGVVVWQGDRFLLVKRGKPPRQGQWSLPGGGQELGETVAETAVREVAEETGIEVTVTELVDVVDSINRDDDGRVSFHATLVDFTAEWRGGEIRPGDDAEDAAWFTMDDLAGLGLWPETERVIRKSFHTRSGHDLSET